MSATLLEAASRSGAGNGRRPVRLPMAASRELVERDAKRPKECLCGRRAAAKCG